MVEVVVDVLPLVYQVKKVDPAVEENKIMVLEVQLLPVVPLVEEMVMNLLYLPLKEMMEVIQI